MPQTEFDWEAAGKGLLEILKDGVKEYVDTTIPEVREKLEELAKEGALYLQAKVKGDPLADHMLAVLTSTARLLAARHAIRGQTATQRVVQQVVKTALEYLALFLRGMLLPT